MTIKEYITISLILEGDTTPEEAIRALLKQYKDLTYVKALQKIDLYHSILKSPPKELVQRFKLGNVEFGFIPDLDKITTAEYLDIDAYQKDIGSIHKLMSILYRPITKKKRSLYRIEDYEGTDKYSKFMLEVDVTIYLSAIAFFLTIYQMSIKDTNTYSNPKKN